MGKVHLVYCDNTGKKGERVLDKILSKTKTMVVRGAAGRKIPHSRVFEGETLYFMEKGTTLSELVKSLNAFGVAPEDLISIFQTLKRDGALIGEIELI